MLKNKKYYKPGHQKRARNSLWKPILIGASIAIGFMGTDYMANCLQGERYMPHKEVIKFCRELDLNTNYFSYLDKPLEKANTRAAFPGKRGIKINVYIDNLTREEKDTLQKVVDDLNEVFEVIRPANKFVLDFTPSFFDRISKFNIDLFELEEKDKTQTADLVGDWNANRVVFNKNGIVTYHSQIRMDRKYIDYQTFMHEIFHHLGFGDAYNLSNDLLDEGTVMLAHDSSLNHLNRGDVALLVAKYGDYSTPEKKQTLVDYINSYEIQHEWYHDYEKQANELIDKFVTEKNIDRSKLNFDLSGKTFIDKDVALADMIMYHKYSFENRKLTDDSVLMMIKDGTKLETYASHTQLADFTEDINGITLIDSYEPQIYFSVDDTLYRVSQQYIFSRGELASPEEIAQFENLVRACSIGDDEVVTQAIVDEIYTEIGQYIPQTDRAMPSSLKLHNATIRGDVIIDGDSITFNNDTYKYIKYKNGIYVPMSTSLSFFIFPDENNKYKYIGIERFGKVTYIEKTLDVLEQTQSYSGEIQEIEF